MYISYTDQDIFPCPFCRDDKHYMEHGEEGYFCMCCGNIINFCEQCRTSMNLLNFFWGWANEEEYDSFSSTFPVVNVGKEYTGIKSDTPGDLRRYINDGTLFYWKCTSCDQETISHCD